MPQQLSDDSKGQLISPFVDVVMNAMAAMLIILILYIILIPPATSPILLPAPIPPAVAFQEYFFACPVEGGTGSRLFAIEEGSLPAELELDATTGLVFGIPRVSGTYPVTISVADGAGSDTTEYSLEVRPTAIPYDPLKMSFALIRQFRNLPAARVGLAYEATIGASGGVEPYSWTTQDPLPPGLVLEDGAIRGVPEAAGEWPFSVTAAFVTGSFSHEGREFNWRGGQRARTYALTVIDEPVAHLTLPRGRVGEQYSAGLILSNRLPDEGIAWDLSVPGLEADDRGSIKGSPQEAGTFSVSYRVVLQDSATATGSDSLVILPERPERQVGHVISLGRVDEDLEFAIPYRGLVEPVRAEATSDLPPGLELEGTLIRGRPREEASTTIHLKLTDALDAVADDVLQISVRPALQPLAITVPESIVVIAGGPFRLGLSAEGGEGVYDWRATGDPTLDLAVRAAILSGTTLRMGFYDARLTVIDRLTAERKSANVVIKAVVEDSTRPRVVTKKLPPAVLGQAYHLQFAASGGIGNVTWTCDQTLPEGIRFTGLGIEGRPLQVGTSQFNVVAQDDKSQKSPPRLLVLGVIDPAGELRRELELVRSELDSVRARTDEFREQLADCTLGRDRLQQELSACEAARTDLRNELKEVRLQPEQAGDTPVEIDAGLVPSEEDPDTITHEIDRVVERKTDWVRLSLAGGCLILGMLLLLQWRGVFGKR
ncbi:putative Ig domain-containing protein [Candidatus Eisenbacteria bacterium]|uniref:Ig domain-containing protein n=1 Tax=Eiseniibacteriota bacterium TaxID=2212470 RepID=A0ABV6YL25_UNCEI